MIRVGEHMVHTGDEREYQAGDQGLIDRSLELSRKQVDQEFKDFSRPLRKKRCGGSS